MVFTGRELKRFVLLLDEEQHYTLKDSITHQDMPRATQQQGCHKPVGKDSILAIDGTRRPLVNPAPFHDGREIGRPEPVLR